MERLDVYDRFGNRTGRTRFRGEAFAPDERCLAASLWVIGARGELLIQKRARHKRTGAGKWSITGGMVSAGEASAVGCAREAYEEIGLRVSPGELVLLTRSANAAILFDVYAVWREYAIEGARLQAEEVEAVRWASAREIERMIDAGDFAFDARPHLRALERYLRGDAATRAGG